MIRAKLLAPLLAGLFFSTLLAIVFGSGCGILGQDEGAGGAAGSACDGQANCDSCAQCAGQDYCRAALDNCQQSSACVGLDQCLGLCGGAVQCEQDCYAGNQSGKALHDALRICLLCEACPGDCAGYTTCE